MKNFKGRAIPLLPIIQIVIVLTVLIVVAAVIAIQATSATTNELQESGTSVNSVAPTMLVATKAPVETGPAEEEPAPPAEGDAYLGNNGGGMTPAYQECAAQYREQMDAAQALNVQGNQMLEQSNLLRSAASASTDQTEITSLLAQADALQLEADRFYRLNNQIWDQLLQGHRGVYCNSEGFAYSD